MASKNQTAPDFIVLSPYDMFQNPARTEPAVLTGFFIWEHLKIRKDHGKKQPKVQGTFGFFFISYSNSRTWCFFADSNIFSISFSTLMTWVFFTITSSLPSIAAITLR